MYKYVFIDLDDTIWDFHANAKLSLYDMFTSAGLTPRFVIVSKGERKEKFPFEYRDDYVGYYDYLKMVGTSRAILDIAQQKQDGYSMRVMEAIFFNKKLVNIILIIVMLTKL